MSITTETRRAAHDEIKPKKDIRRQQIIEAITEYGPMSVPSASGGAAAAGSWWLSGPSMSKKEPPPVLRTPKAVSRPKPKPHRHYKR